MMVGIYIGIALCAVVIVSLFVDNLDQETTKKTTKDVLTATIKQLRKKKQLALLPVTMHTGFSQAAFSAEFTKVNMIGNTHCVSKVPSPP